MSDPECPRCEADVPDVDWQDNEATCPKCGYISDVESEYIDNDTGFIVTLVEKEEK
jgi:acetone carboxylase gamma subunit